MPYVSRVERTSPRLPSRVSPPPTETGSDCATKTPGVTIAAATHAHGSHSLTMFMVRAANHAILPVLCSDPCTIISVSELPAYKGHIEPQVDAIFKREAASAIRLRQSRVSGIPAICQDQQQIEREHDGRGCCSGHKDRHRAEVPRRSEILPQPPYQPGPAQGRTTWICRSGANRLIEFGRPLPFVGGCVPVAKSATVEKHCQLQRIFVVQEMLRSGRVNLISDFAQRARLRVSCAHRSPGFPHMYEGDEPAD
jgi:hypothetical protein